MGPSPSLTVPLSSSQKSLDADHETTASVLPSSLPTHTFKPPLSMSQEVIIIIQ
jgi:hypothetical protein